MQRRYVVWLNGCPGAGKTSVAHRLCATDQRYRLLDAEAVGRTIQRFVPGLRDYQTSALWFWVIRSWCRWRTRTDRIPVVPMSLMEQRPRQQVIDHLRRGDVEVIEVLLTASTARLRQRIADRGGPVTGWCLRELPRFYQLSGDIRPSIFLDSESASIESISAMVHTHLGTYRGFDAQRSSDGRSDAPTRASKRVSMWVERRFGSTVDKRTILRKKIACDHRRADRI